MKYIGVFWTNRYLSSIQHGIQTGHVIGNMNASPNDPVAFKQWSQWDFTVDVRNGGDHKSLVELKEFLEAEAMNYTWSYFNESQDAMNGMMTCVGIVLPIEVFDPPFQPEYRDNMFEAEIYRKIKATRHAI